MCFHFVYTDMDTNFILNIFTSTYISRKRQGSPTYFFPRATKSFPFGPKIQETPPDKIGGHQYPIFVICNNAYSKMTTYHNMWLNIHFIEMTTSYYIITTLF
jgi:hypothetical protein